MKDLVKKSKAFILFENSLKVSVINHRFNITHTYYQEKFPYWSFSASREKNVAEFWLGSMKHFFVILGIGVVLNFVLTESRDLETLLISTLWVGIVSLLILSLTLYRRIIYFDYLPKLDTIIAELEFIQKQDEDVSKSKREQFTAPTLTVIYYVFSKTSGTQILPSNDLSGELLNRMFGVTKAKLTENLRRIYKISELSPKERSEIQKGIDNARDFFKSLDSPSASLFLNELELKLNRRKNYQY